MSDGMITAILAIVSAIIGALLSSYLNKNATDAAKKLMDDRLPGILAIDREVLLRRIEETHSTFRHRFGNVEQKIVALEQRLDSLQNQPNPWR